MLPAGFLVLVFLRNSERHLQCGRIKALTDLRELINKTDKKNKNIPDWLSDTNRLIAFSIAIRVENKLHLLEELFEDKDVYIIEKL